MPTMIRPTWKPKTPAQAQALANVSRAAKKADDLRRRADAAEAEMWAAVVEARDLDVSDLALCEEPGITRSTLNRRYGTRSNPKIPVSDTRTV